MVRTEFLLQSFSVRATHVGYVSPSLEIRAHDTPVKKQVDDEEENGEQEESDHPVVVHETGQTSDVHDPADSVSFR